MTAVASEGTPVRHHRQRQRAAVLGLNPVTHAALQALA